MMIKEKHSDYREYALHERINLLRENEYRGWNVTGANQKWDGVRVTVMNTMGNSLMAEGETLDEAYENAIELIDVAVDGPP